MSYKIIRGNIINIWKKKIKKMISNYDSRWKEIIEEYFEEGMKFIDWLFQLPKELEEEYLEEIRNMSGRRKCH
ncbi:MAG TPA: hypothetical protein PLD27_00625 [bacterium]|nr:hypothetical protein [bacterium]HOL47778.1 hypothetical protein [bacterium]HPQ18295.1 hypothetical protein [bacterium]